MARKVTIKDVAKACKVSEATVSRVMSDSPLISEKNKEKSKKVIEEMNYFPNYSAVSLTKSSSKIIAIIVENQTENPLENDFYTEIVSNVVTFSNERDYYILYVHSENKEKINLEIKKLINTNRIDGILFLSLFENDDIMQYLDEIEFPYVTIGKLNEGLKGLWVDTDNLMATYEVTKKLIESGKKKIGFLAGPKDLVVSIYRYLGYEKAMNEYNLKIDKSQVKFTKFDMESAEKATKKIIECGNIEGIVTTDDILAIGALKYLSKLKKDVIVTGFNNSKLRKYLKQKFITVDINYTELARSSVFLLIDRIENRKIKNNGIIIPSTIIGG